MLKLGKIRIPVDTETAPIIKGGIAKIRAPKAPTTDRSCACAADLTDKTRWKYACHGIVPSI